VRAGLRELVVTDALLRMYCAVLDEDRGGAGSLWPPHPGFPGRTRALPLRETGPHSVWQATEYLMRPLAVVARVAGEHGVVLDLDPARFRIEVDRDDRPTGRVVVELLPDAEGDASLPDWLLTRCVDRVAERCFTGGQEARAWLREVAEHELAVGPAFRRELNTASNTRSIAQIRLSDLSSRPTAKSHGVWLTAAQTKRLTGQLVRAAVTSGERTVERVTRWGSTLPPTSGEERIARLIHRVLSRKQFRQGSLRGYPPTRALTDMLAAIRHRAPIHAVLPAFPIKHADSGLKAFGTLPDLAEFGFLVRLKELHAAVSGVYAPGMRITLLSDAQHYRPREVAQTKAYAEKIGEYVQMAEASDFIEVRDIDEVAGELLDTRDRPARLAAHMRALTEAFAQLDIVADPLAPTDQAASSFQPGVAALFTSLVHSVPVPLPDGADRRDWSARVYADLYRTDGSVPPALAVARAAVLRAAWEAAIGYAAVLRTDRDLAYDAMFGTHIGLTALTPGPGRCGFAGLGGSGLLPWHGTAAVDRRGVLSTDFAISLLDRAFVPVYADVLDGADQPWFMAPITAIEVAGSAGPGSGPARLSDAFLDTVRLRTH
jgi:pyoverdine/dityrosine biosynthesis protein